MGWKVYVTSLPMGSIGKPAVETMRAAGLEVVIPPKWGPLTGKQLETEIAGYDAILATVDDFNAETLRSPALKSLKIISRWGVGYDTIDIPAATAEGIVVAYTPGLLDNAVADYAFSLLCSAARRVAEGYHLMLQGKWQRTWGTDIYGKTLGIIGCGRIGQAVAKRARGFDMNVIGYDPAPHPDAGKCGLKFVSSLDELLGQSDFVSLHTALTPQTRNLINEERLRKMKKSAYLINTARGPVVDEAALVKALHEGWIAGAALDVFVTEPLPAESALRGCPNLLMTAHQATFGEETGAIISQAAADAIIDLSRGRAPKYMVDPNVIKAPNLRAKLAK